MNFHASCVVMGEDRAVLLIGPPGVGKSTVALRLILEYGAQLLADDQTLLSIKDGALWASPPEPTKGLLEVVGAGILSLPFNAGAQVDLAVLLHPLGQEEVRLPEIEAVFLLDQPVRSLRLRGQDAATPARIAAAMLYPLAAV